jgi:starch synthase
MAKNLKILFLSPEAVPFAKTGGLADVAGALPIALRKLGVDVRLILPFYRMVREGGFKTESLLKGLEISVGGHLLPANIHEARMEGDVPVYLVDREDLFDRPNLYGNATGDYYDNLERFCFFSSAALRVAEEISFRPDLTHCHDWQSGLVPALLKGPYLDHSFWAKTRTLFTVHNLGYQGVFPAEKLSITGLPGDTFFRQEGLEFWGKISLLKAGIVYSEAITTVSPTYAREIQTPEFGLGMDGILRVRKAFLHGILNGVDYRLWDPALDSHLPASYGPGKMAGKRRGKESLIQEMALDPSLKDRPLFGMVSRLDKQKGLDLLVEILPDLLSLDAGLVVLGSGDEAIQNALEKAVQDYPGRVGLKVGFDEPLAHRIVAGSDFFLIPSRYEPCGLTQMYALKYGTVPVVRATGGLEDTIKAFDPQKGNGNGFKFGPYEPKAFLAAIKEAIDVFNDSTSWKRIVKNAMKDDFSWNRSARTYVELYESIINRGQTLKPTHDSDG